MSTFNIILETTSITNVLVNIICSYNNFRPTAYLFARSYLRKRLGKKIFKYVKVHKMVGKMVPRFEKMVEKINHLTQTMTVEKACKDHEEWADRLFCNMELMFPLMAGCYDNFGPDDAPFMGMYWEQCMRQIDDASFFVIPPLISFAKGQPWVSPVIEEEDVEEKEDPVEEEET